MKISKSTRHAKITGDFGEALVLYWLSKYGFECAPVDHTGIDIIARNPHTNEVMGISVKSRSRTEGPEEEYVSIPNDSTVEVFCGVQLCRLARYEGQRWKSSVKGQNSANRSVERTASQPFALVDETGDRKGGRAADRNPPAYFFKPLPIRASSP